MKRKFYSWDACLKLREIKALKNLRHTNIVKLKEVIRENDELYFVFEHMERNLLEKIKAKHNFFTETETFDMFYQIMLGIEHMHSEGFFHRDIKPENILCTGNVVKIADLGLAREIRSLPPYTEYVSTRWYRSPELLLLSSAYNSPVDIWALGCILYEMITFQPLFPGKNEIDQLMKICSILGSPCMYNSWNDAEKMATNTGFTWPLFNRVPLRSFVSTINPCASSKSIKLIEDILTYDPQKRLTATQILNSSIFTAETQNYSQSTSLESQVFYDVEEQGNIPVNSNEFETESVQDVNELLTQIEGQYFSVDKSSQEFDSQRESITDNSLTVMSHEQTYKPDVDFRTTRPDVNELELDSFHTIEDSHSIESKTFEAPTVSIRPVTEMPMRFLQEKKEQKQAKKGAISFNFCKFSKLKSPKRLLFKGPGVFSSSHAQQSRKRIKRSWPTFLNKHRK